VAKQIMAIDPTRPVMVDGGQALTDASLPVVGGHYLETDQRDYPDHAYTLEKTYAAKSRNQWPTPADRPIFLGESFFARGCNPAWFAGIGGESCFLGRSETVRPCGLYAKMLSEGYRWHGLAAFHYWFADDDATLHYNAFQPVCALCRQWNWTFAAGATVPRTLKVLNDTRYPDPIEMAWRLTLDGTVVGEGKKVCNIPPGLSETIEISVKIPVVEKRTAGQFILTCGRAGKEVFREVKEVSIIDANAAPKPVVAKADIMVLDPNGSARRRLAARGVPFTELARFEDIPDSARIIVVGNDALTGRQATDPKWMALAAAGARILVLEQQVPLHYQAVPADFEPTAHVGRIAFAENLDHPAFAGLDQADFFCWSGDHIVYRNVYKKPSIGAKSLAQCDMELSCSAIAECPVNEGLLLLCQMVVGGKLATDPVPQRLFDNMVNYVSAYKVVRKQTAVVMDDTSPQAKLLVASGLKFDTAPDALSAITDGKHETVVLDATPANLKVLAANPDKLNSFARNGGWLMLWGLTPEGLADFNRIVAVDHLIRPFEMERVTLPAVRDPILAGLTMRDVVMESGEKIMAHVGDKFLANDIFTCVVDFDDIAPFSGIPGPEYWNQPGAKPGYDHWPRNMFNGFVTADSWKYVFSILLSKNEPTRWTMKLPREEEIIQFSIALNTIYHKVTKINLYFDADDKPVALNARPIPDRQDFIVGPRKAKALTIELAEWEKSGTQDVIGVDNIWLRVKRPDDFQQKVKPLLNIGALVRYPMGSGGVILNQLRIMPTETVPINTQKKQTIVATLLRNLGAAYAGGQTLTAANLSFQPIPLDNQCNQYLTRDRGWFDPQRDLGHLPAGEQKLAHVTYAIHDFKTSPVPSCIMLAGQGAKGNMPREFRGLKVDRKADALFFLHTFRQARQWRPRPNETTPPTVFKYVVHYADGNAAEAPVLYGQGVDHWISSDPRSLKSAALAWAGKFPGDASEQQAVVYQMQWKNPRPDVPIATIDLVYDQKAGNQYGVPALLAVTAASARQ
jgi:beta-galactosidase